MSTSRRRRWCLRLCLNQPAVQRLEGVANRDADILVGTCDSRVAGDDDVGLAGPLDLDVHPAGFHRVIPAMGSPKYDTRYRNLRGQVVESGSFGSDKIFQGVVLRNAFKRDLKRELHFPLFFGSV
jgi:hypothetical protein